MPDNKKFWQFRNQAGGTVELLLYGDISQSSWWGDEVTPKQFADELAGLGALDKIVVRINSGGGDVFAAQTIGNLLEQHPAEVTARIDGLCASAATIVACHCGKVVAANDSTYMVHPVRIGACGYYDAAELGQYIEALAAIKESIVGLYVKKTGRDKDEVTAWMDATSWWTAAAARDNGFVDELVDEEDAVVENRGGTLFVNSVSMHTFFQENEHAEWHTVDGKKALIILETEQLKERSAHWEAGAKQNFDTGLYTSRMVLYIRAADYGPKPKVGKHLVLDKGTKTRTFSILTCEDQAGVYRMTMERTRQ